MQVTETLSEGLRREFRIVVPATDIARQLDSRLTQLGGQVRLPGFRPGRVPLAILKKRYGRSVMGEILESTVNESTRTAMNERGLRPALKPKVEVDRFVEGRDLEYTVQVEVLPEVTLEDFADIALERLVADVPEEEVDKRLNALAEAQRTYKAPAEPRPARPGDRLVLDYRGSVDGEARANMAENGRAVVLGAGRLIPGFEDQLIGRSEGDHATIEVTFPADYQMRDLAGKAASFEIDVKELAEPEPLAIDDTLAKGLGLEDLEKLKDALRRQVAAEFSRQSRARLKRQLLDRLAERYHFPVPAGMVDLEFAAIWRQVEEARKAGNADDPDLAKPEEQLREEYRAIAERRVRLGLVLSETGRLNSIAVTVEEMNRAAIEEARRYPGQEQEVLKALRSNPQAAEGLRAPLFEDKVVDFILGLARVEERTVTPEELARDPDLPAPAAGTGPEAEPEPATGSPAES